MGDLEPGNPQKIEASHVLVVDDEPLARESLRSLLEDEGYLVTLASNGAEAVRILERDPVHVLCSDFQMPGMNGLELLEAAKQISPATVCVLITGYPDYVSGRMGESRHLLLMKPYSPDGALRIVAQAARFSRIRSMSAPDGGGRECGS